MNDPVTASTPPLVDVIAGVLAEHHYFWSGVGNSVVAGCSCQIDELGNIVAPLTEDFLNHQARAVLDALTKAGGVEWGVRYEWTNDQGHPESDVAIKRTEAHARQESEFEGSLSTIGHIPGPRISTVSRITGPWTAAEG